MPSNRAKELAGRCRQIELNRPQILAAVQPYRQVEIRLWDGGVADSIIHQIRVDGEQRHIFFCNTDRRRARYGTRIRIKGDWDVTLQDTIKGESTRLASRREGDATVVDWNFEAHSSLLLTLTPGWKSGGVQPAAKQHIERGRLTDPVAVTLSEPNALLLSQADWRFNDEPWQGLEEILRLDSALRKRLGLPAREGGMAQPWTDREPVVELGTLRLRFVINAESDVANPQLALEEAGRVEILWDGQRVASDVVGLVRR